MSNENSSNLDSSSKKILRYPFNGRSSYLIDKFYIFGYDLQTIKSYFYKDDNLKIILNDNIKKYKLFINEFELLKFKLSEKPSLLNEFTSDYEKETLEIDMIIDLIFPRNINIFYTEEEKSNKYTEKKIKKRESSSVERSSPSDKKEDFFSLFDEKENYNKKDINSQSYNVVFSSNPQSGNNSKKSINGFAYIFYKKLKEEKKFNNKYYTFYIPITFCVISEYPFYNSFYQLCKQISCLFPSYEIRMPLEIFIHNLVNLTPSPLNADVCLSLKSIKNFDMDLKNNSEKTIADIQEEEYIEEKDNIINNPNDNTDLMSKITYNPNENYGNLNLNQKSKSEKFNSLQQGMNSGSKSKRTRRTVIAKKNDDGLSSHQIISKGSGVSNIIKHIKTSSMTFLGVNIPSNSNDYELLKKIKFEYLRGYPVIQYNLAKVLLQTLSPIDVIDIFLYTFLEKDVLFFSKDLEFLSLTINSYLNLNFPLNDEKYYFINACVSYENYLKGDSTFVGSTFTTMIGINSAYNPKYQNDRNNKLKEHLAVDLDNGKVYKVEDKNDLEKSRKNKELFTFIKNICKNRENSNMTNILYREINILNNVLTDLYSKMKERISSEEYNIYYNIYRINSYISYDKNIKDINLKIQDSFYRFINNISLYFYQNLSIKSESDDNRSKKLLYDNIEGEMNVIFLKDDDNYSKEELILLEELTETMKFQSFVYGFVQSYNPIDLYKIPLTFTEEFLSIISRKSGILDKEINFLSLIDKLYGIDSEGEINIDLEPILIDYYTNYKSYFDREIEDNCTKYALYPEKIKIKTYSHYKKIIKYKGYELDDRILNKYLHLLNELNEKKDNIFFRLKAMVKANIPKTISVTSIESIIEEYAMETKILSPSDFCCANILILFTLSLRHLKSVNLSYFLGMLLNSFTVFRKYYSMILSMIYIIVEESLKKKDYNNVEKHLNLYYLCINSLRNYKLIPNENLMNMIKKFNKIDLKSLPANTNLNNTEDKPDNLQVYKITPKNLYITHNFTSIRIYHEKEIVQKVNDRSNDDDFFKCNEEKLLQPKIKYREGVELHQSLFYSQKTILSSLNEEYKNYIIDRDENKFGEKIILDACLNIIIFMRNTEAFSKENDIIETVVMIFNIFMNKFVQVKKIHMNINNNSIY